jgi:hypothetical protein
LYEAAEVDGANRWKQTLHITLPGMLPMIILLTTLSIGGILNAGFDQNGTKFYVDNQLVKTTNRTFDYRMMTFLGLYPQGGMDKANKTFPKEFTIDYFRIYKKEQKKVSLKNKISERLFFAQNHIFYIN